MSARIGRRSVLKGGGGLVLAFTLGRAGESFGAAPAAARSSRGSGVKLEPSGYLRIGEDSAVTVFTTRKALRNSDSVPRMERIISTGCTASSAGCLNGVGT